MAVVIEDYASDHSRFHHDMLAAHHLATDYHYIPTEPTPRHQPRALASPANYRQTPAESTTSSKRSWEPSDVADPPPQVTDEGPAGQQKVVASTAAASRLPSPPESSSSATPSPRQAVEDAKSSPAGPMSAEKPAAAAAVPGADTKSSQQQTPPAPDGSPRLAPYNSDTFDGTTVVVRDLDHISELAQEDILNRGSDDAGILNNPPLQVRRYDISSMPIGDIIEMVGALLTKITTTNDRQHDSLHRNAAHQLTAANHNNDGAVMSPLSSSVLAFHGKHVPCITINSYLARIHKYCPTTYEVFLSLLVYFDRMTARVNQMVEAEKETAASEPNEHADTVMEDGDGDGSHETDPADDEDDESQTATQPAAASSPTYFVVDSFNIHRLIIAGVTCASKFFSDVFYTNSRYGKVGGLPLGELNHLELQFLLLNDFRLAIPVEDLDAYATTLVEFYARDMVETPED